MHIHMHIQSDHMQMHMQTDHMRSHMHMHTDHMRVYMHEVAGGRRAKNRWERALQRPLRVCGCPHLLPTRLSSHPP